MTEPVDVTGGGRVPEGGRVPGRIAVGVSGAGSNLRALVAASRRGAVGGEVVLVFADRPCPALDWAAAAGIETVVIPVGADDALAAALAGARAKVVVLAGYMRVVGPIVLDAYRDRIINVHPSLLPAFPGAHAVADALAHGVRVSGATIHLVDATLDGGPIVAQEAVAVLAGDDEATLHERIRAVEHRLLPHTVALLLTEAVSVRRDDRRVVVDAAVAAAAVPRPRRALLSVSDKRGLVPFAQGLARLGFELVSTGGTARALRDAGLAVTEVASVTGFPEMLDGRVKTLHPRIHAGLLADERQAGHRAALAGAAIDPFELVVVNLYPFATALQQPGIDLDGLIEEIDIGGPTLVRAAAKNHRGGVTVVTSPDRYEAVQAALSAAGGVPDGLRAALAIEAFRETAAYDARIAAELPFRERVAGTELPPEPGLPGSDDPYPARLVVALEKVETLRYGENPHQPAARYRRPGATAGDGPFATGELPLQGKPLSYNNVLDASAAVAVARSIRGPGAVVVKHTNPCGAAERGSLLEAWEAALAGDPVSAFGGVVALTRPVDAAVARALAGIFLEIVAAPAFEDAALEVLAAKANLRLVVDPYLATGVTPSGPGNAIRSDHDGSIRTAGGAVLVAAPDDQPDDPSAWTVATRRAPTGRERRDLDLAWRIVRGASSNAIALVRDGRLIGLGSGQTSRVDAARQAVDKARAISGRDALDGAACASDAFFPFPDGVEVCLAAGVRSFVQPGGSVRDAEVVATADRAAAAMLVTGVRHFRH
ncbi:MAG TPA: bifunctional phosphoribosylaminoimidazolecarboxamide formyltransferase/IMP cyclohydrolase [Candidatus Limnocylindrales bacterium]|nr:bifunctional phosphoribosylaminoimidazolecarboxamide formyltransferase/IMP cyclohydrolase [Candidatus Limnocylindrales bacterium]